MQVRRTRVVVALSKASALFVLLQACTPVIGQDNAVAAAYKTSDAVYVMPYNRTIFSSNNF